MIRVAVLGAGSLGTIFGARLTQSGSQKYDVTLVDAYQAHVDALNKNGATVVGKLELNVPVKAVTPDKMEGFYDYVIYLAKQTHNDSALTALLPHLKPTSTVAVLQNGIPEPAVAKYVGEERVVSVPVGWGATFKGPGVSELTSAFEKMTYEMGELDGSIKERTIVLQDILNQTGHAEIVNNVAGIRWAKLFNNAALSGMSAALGLTFGQVLDNDKAALAVAHIGNESMVVAEGSGVKLEKLQGNDITVLKFKTAEERASKVPIYHAIYKPHRDLKASMLQDLEKGNKTEVDAILGSVCETGKEFGIPTPVSDQVRQIIKDCENGKRKPSIANLDDIKIPEIK